MGDQVANRSKLDKALTLFNKVFIQDRPLERFTIGDREFTVRESIHAVTRRKYHLGIYSKGRTQTQIPLNGGEPIYAYIFSKLSQGLLATEFDGRVLVLGVCGAAIPRYFLSAYPHCHVTGIEYEPIMIDVAKRHFLGDLPEDKFALVHDDAANFVRQETSRNAFDIVVCDIFYNASLPHDIYTREFFEQVLGNLCDNGFAIFNLCGLEAHLARQYFDNIKAVFGVCEVVAGGGGDIVALTGRNKNTIQKSLMKKGTFGSWRWIMSY